MKKYIVIGNPIEHSLSPKLHNHWIKENNINAVYDKKEINEKDIKSIISEIKNKKINGINVTVPFKKSVIPFMDKLSPEANESQSVNTIYLNDNKIIGHNTDIAGFELAIKYSKYDLTNKEILILGAGGVVSSLIFSLKKMRASKITISLPEVCIIGDSLADVPAGEMTLPINFGAYASKTTGTYDNPISNSPLSITFGDNQS